MSDLLSIEFRPKVFEEFIGNKDIIRVLQSKQEIPTALMFCGPSGSGKTTLARIIASSEFNEIIEKNASDTNGVDDARALAEYAEYETFFPGLGRVIILDEAQKLTSEAQNVLLKPMETSSKTKWIICTTEPNKIIKSLQKRCLSFTLKPLNISEIQQLINLLVQKYPFHQSTPIDVSLFVAALRDADICYPRDILMAYDRYRSGMTIQDSVQNLEEEIEYIELVRSIAKGEWNQVSKFLKSMKPADGPAIRNVLSAYLATMLTNSQQSTDTAEKASKSLGILALRNSVDGAAWPITKGAIYEICKIMKGMV